jgi:protocatechuate 3,4-dioxygenase beta subunit
MIRIALAVVLAAVLTRNAAPQTATERAPEQQTRCKIEGLVIQDPGGRPIRKVNVRVAADGAQEDRSYAAVTDGEGRFQIEDMVPGSYRVFLDHMGFLPVDKNRPINQTTGKSLFLNPGQEIKDLVFHMLASATIVGKVMDVDGDPVPGTLVEVSRRRNAPGAQRFVIANNAYTNDLGEFRIADLQPGTYIVQAEPSRLRGRGEPPSTSKEGAQGEKVFGTTYYPGTFDRSQAVPLEVHPGDEMPVKLTLLKTRAFHVRGTVVGLEATGAGIMLRTKEGETAVLGFSIVKKDGTFDIHGVLPGSYTAFLFPESGKGEPEIVAENRLIQVTNADVEGVQLLPIRFAQVRGQFRMDPEQKIDWSELSVRLDPDGDNEYRFFGEAYSARVQKNGSFELKNIGPGAYPLTLGSGDPVMRGHILQSAYLGGKDVADSGFTVEGRTYSFDLAVSEKSATIEGIVLDEKHQAVSDVEVVCYPEEKRRKRPDAYHGGTSDAQGHFRFHSLNPGEYTVFAFEDPEDSCHDPDLLESCEARGESVQIEQGKSKSIVVRVISTTAEQP